MIQEVEINSLNIKYESYRLKNKTGEAQLLQSILEKGIQEPVEGIDVDAGRILIDGFKRYRGAIKLGIGTIPYVSIGNDEAIGIIQFLRRSNAKSLNILEQAKLIDELKNIYKLSIIEIAQQLEKSKAWVSMRVGLIENMDEEILEKIFNEAFPVYSYMYTLRSFMRMNSVKKEQINEFVNLVSGKKLSIRDIEWMAHGYFKGPESFREQMKTGNITWGLNQIKKLCNTSNDCSELEKGLLNDLSIIGKYMQRIIFRADDPRYQSNTFFAEANLLTGRILSRIKKFSEVMEALYDRSGRA